MRFLSQYVTRHRRQLVIGFCALAVGVAATWWIGAEQAQASERPLALFQTVPPTPPPAPTAPPPTPTPRPRDKKEDKNDTPPASPTPAPSAVSETAPASGAATSPLTGVINATTLNVRQGPGAAFPVVGRLPNGTVVTVVARNVDNTWLNICCLPDGQTQGWVSAQFVTPNYTVAELEALPLGDGATLIADITPTASDVVAPVVTLPAGALRGVVAAVSLNVRAAPSTNAAVLGKLSNGASVALIGRNAASDWWLACCVPGGAENGWVSAQFITTDADAAMLAALPVTTGRDTPIAAIPAASATATPVAASDALSPTVLALTAALEPEFPMQGEQLLLAFTLTNSGDANAVNVEFSFEVPSGLGFVSASAEDGGEVTAQETDAGATLIVVTWPELAAGGVTTTRLSLAVDATLADGAVIDGAAAALADNAEATSVAISVGMPPASPPDFQ
ncbi:MAG TPA: SH3 domain-containing protein [Chloroflexi bacterium]|nr:SH3 domain-containing protein [Chloroflexota bacterium]